MSIIIYPAIVHEENNQYWIEFPDLEGCFSSGNSFEEAYINAKDALGMYLDQENDAYERYINKPSEMKTIIEKFPDQRVLLIEFNSLEYARKYRTKAVKKTLSIPQWLNDEAIKQNINFSSILQEALIEKLKIIL